MKLLELFAERIRHIEQTIDARSDLVASREQPRTEEQHRGIRCAYLEQLKRDKKALERVEAAVDALNETLPRDEVEQNLFLM